jgi:hypothetical protein
MKRLFPIPLVLATVGICLAVCLSWLVASASVPARFSYHRGAGGAVVKTAESTGVEFTSDKRKPQSLITRKVRVPHGAHRLAIIGLSAVCSHDGGNPGDYTTVEALARFDKQRRFAVGGAAPNLVFCTDLGDGANYKVGASHSWTLPLDGGLNRVVIRYASVGEGEAHLSDLVLTVTLYKHPCACP